MELVGRYISVVEDDRGIKMDFHCTNKEIFREILVPPVLKTIPGGVIRIFLHLKPGYEAGQKKQWILNHCEGL